MYNKAQGLLEGESSAILGLVGSSQFMSILKDYVILLKVVPRPLPSCLSHSSITKQIVEGNLELRENT